MNNSIYPCVCLHTEVKQAAAFYQQTFPHTKLEEENEYVSYLDMAGQKFMILNAGPNIKPNQAMSFMVLCDEASEAKDYWNKLAFEGQSLMQLGSYPWSELYGWVKDKYGVHWQVYYNQKRPANQKFVPTLMFSGKAAGRAEEAIHFYTKLFPVSGIQGILKYPEGNGFSKPGYVQHAQFEINDYVLMAMDNDQPDGEEFSEGNSLTVITQNQQETDFYWDNLVADGGKESVCGWLTDKFGLSWQIVPQRLLELTNHEDKDAAKRAMDAMLKMRKIDIAELEAAAGG